MSGNLSYWGLSRSFDRFQKRLRQRRRRNGRFSQSQHRLSKDPIYSTVALLRDRGANDRRPRLRQMRLAADSVHAAALYHPPWDGTENLTGSARFLR